DGRVTSTRSQEHAGVEPVVASAHAFDFRPESIPVDRLGKKSVHAGSEAELAILGSRSRCQRDHRQVPAGHTLFGADALDPLKTIEAGHVQIEQQEVELLGFEAGEHIVSGAYDGRMM